MKWSKVKKSAESLLADSLKGRVAYHVTRYGNGVSCMAARGWVTLDKCEILSASTDHWLQGRPGAVSRDQLNDALQG